jgi:hypothetical protein
MYNFRLNGSARWYDDNFVVRMHLLMTTFARLGAELWDTDATMVNPGPFILKAIGQDMLGQHYSIGYPALSHALLQRSETKIRELLSGRCEEDLAQLLQEKGPWDQPPLHVSTSWPRGMQLIFELAGKAIENVVDMKDDRGKTTLDYAIRLREIDSIKTLYHRRPRRYQARFGISSQASEARETFSGGAFFPVPCSSGPPETTP